MTDQEKIDEAFRILLSRINKSKNKNIQNEYMGICGFFYGANAKKPLADICEFDYSEGYFWIEYSEFLRETEFQHAAGPLHPIFIPESCMKGPYVKSSWLLSELQRGLYTKD